MPRFLVLASFLGPAAAAAPLDDVGHPRLRDCSLPADLQDRWERGRMTDAQLSAELEAFRRARPLKFGGTEPPPEGVRAIADFEKMRVLHLALPGWIDHDDTYVSLLVHASKQGRVRVSASSERDTARIIAKLRDKGAVMDRIEFDHVEPVETIWMRDYGPIPVSTSAGSGVVDFNYAPDCTNDDAYPTRSRAEGQQIWRSDTYIDGGNLVTDGQGTCFTTEELAYEAATTTDVVGEVVRRWAGCDRLVVLEALEGDSAPHVDMLLTAAPNGVLLLASFDPTEDAANAEVMKRNRRRLVERAGKDGHADWKLVDLPTPPTLHRPDATVVRTWNNLLPFNGVVFVPDYSKVPTERVVQAWNLIQAAYPGRELRGVAADPLIEFGGAVHCIGRAEP